MHAAIAYGRDYVRQTRERGDTPEEIGIDYCDDMLKELRLPENERAMIAEHGLGVGSLGAYINQLDHETIQEDVIAALPENVRTELQAPMDATDEKAWEEERTRRHYLMIDAIAANRSFDGRWLYDVAIKSYQRLLEGPGTTRGADTVKELFHLAIDEERDPKA